MIFTTTEIDNLFANLNTISGDLNVGGTLNLVRTPSSGVALSIISSSSSGATGASFQSAASGQGFLINYTTAQSATPWTTDRKSTRLNSSHSQQSRMPSSA